MCFPPISEGAVAGGAAGVVVETALYPIDTIKMRLQVSWLHIYMECAYVQLILQITHTYMHGKIHIFGAD